MAAVLSARFADTPALMHIGGNVYRADRMNRGLHVHHRSLVHAVINSERAGQRVLIPARLGSDELAPLVGPELLPAHAVPMPALERTPAGGSVVILAFPLVIKAGQVIQHPRADPIDWGKCTAQTGRF